MKTCFLIGHRDAPFAIRGKLEKAIAKAIADYGVTEFVVGQYGRFPRPSTKPQNPFFSRKMGTETWSF